MNPGVPVLDDERRDALLLRRLRVRAREDHAEAAHGPLRDEGLRAVEHPVVAVAARGGPQGRRVAAAPRLGQRPGGEPAPARGRRQVLSLLLLAAERQEVSGPEPVVRGDRQRGRPVDPGDLLDAEGISLRVHAGAAVLLRDADAEQPHAGELRYELRRKSLLAVPPLRVRRDLGASELADALAQKPVVLVEVEVHEGVYPD